MQKAIIIALIVALCPLLIKAQSGNVGVGTTNPQAKLHVDGSIRADNEIVIKNSAGQTVFILNPETRTFDMLEDDGTVFHRIGIGSSNNLNPIQNMAFDTTGIPDFEFFKDFNQITTTERKPNNNPLFSRTITNTGSTDTEYFDSGVKKREIVDDGATKTITTFYENGNPKEVRIIDYGADDGFTVEKYSASGNIVERITKVANSVATGGSYESQERFDGSGNLLFKFTDDNGTRKYFNSLCQEVTEEFYGSLYSKTIKNPFSGASNSFSAESIGILDGTGNLFSADPFNAFVQNAAGNKAEIKPDNVSVNKGNNTTSLKDIGIHQSNPVTLSDFFADCNGISKLENTGFAGFGFDPNTGKIIIEGGLDVIGDLTVNGNKSFKIDHPLDPYNKFLVHNAVEAPAPVNMYQGNITTDDTGIATVLLPDYFEALNINYTYQLTTIGSFAQAIILEEVQNNQFKIQTSEPNTKVSWQVLGERNDPYFQDNPFEAEQTKKGSDKGKLTYDPNRSEPYSEGLKIHWQEHQKNINNSSDQ